jgi:hypothetical protein
VAAKGDSWSRLGSHKSLETLPGCAPRALNGQRLGLLKVLIPSLTCQRSAEELNGGWKDAHVLTSASTDAFSPEQQLGEIG